MLLMCDKNKQELQDLLKQKKKMGVKETDENGSNKSIEDRFLVDGKTKKQLEEELFREQRERIIDDYVKDLASQSDSDD